MAALVHFPNPMPAILARIPWRCHLVGPTRNDCQHTDKDSKEVNTQTYRRHAHYICRTQFQLEFIVDTLAVRREIQL